MSQPQKHSKMLTVNHRSRLSRLHLTWPPHFDREADDRDMDKINHTFWKLYPEGHATIKQFNIILDQMLLAGQIRWLCPLEERRAKVQA